jgi:hypothetical protein
MQHYILTFYQRKDQLERWGIVQTWKEKINKKEKRFWSFMKVSSKGRGKKGERKENGLFVNRRRSRATEWVKEERERERERERRR